MKTGSPGKKLLLLCTSAGIGGTERVVQSLARVLSQYGESVRTVFPVVETTSAVLQWFAKEGVSAEANPAVPHVHRTRSFQDVLTLRHFVRASGADIVNIHYGVNHISFKDVLALRLAGCKKVIVSVQHAVPFGNPRTARATRLGAKWAQTVVVSTQAMHSLLTGIGVPESKIQLIPLGVSAPARHVSPSDARALFGLPEAAFVISTLARLVPAKGIADLITAASCLPDPQNRLRLLIAGDGEARAALEALASDCLPGKVTFTGHVPETSAAA